MSIVKNERFMNTYSKCLRMKLRQFECQSFTDSISIFCIRNERHLLDTLP